MLNKVATLNVQASPPSPGNMCSIYQGSSIWPQSVALPFDEADHKVIQLGFPEVTGFGES